MSQQFLKFRLTVMNFLEFAVWGAYLTSLGNYLGSHGLGQHIGWFYVVQGLVSLFMPGLIGMLADRWVQAQRLLGICHGLAGSMMLGLAYLGSSSPTPDPALFIAIYTLSVAFYMPTLALSNTAAFTILKNHGLDTVTHFPPIRVFGTVGFIATMWFVNCAYLTDGSFGFTLAREAGKFQYTYMQFGVSGVLGILLCLYCFTLPSCPLVKHESGRTLTQMLGLDAFRLFREKRMALFFIFSMLLGMSLQVTNGYAGPFITHFIAQPEYADSFAANNATLLVSLSQASETCCILLIPFFMKRFGIKRVMMISMLAWVFRFGLFGLGDPGSGLWMFILSMIVYGVAFDFFNVSGALFVDQNTNAEMRSSAQGLFMIMTNGLGASIGTWTAQQIVNHYVYEAAAGSDVIEGWRTCWFIFAAYALCVLVLFTFVFKERKGMKPLKEKA